jgi:hypothetical protein
LKVAAAGRQAVALRVAQDLTTIKLIQGVRTGTAGESHRVGAEQLLQLLDDPEDANLLVLIDVKDIINGDDALQGNGLVVRFDARGNACDFLPCVVAPRPRKARDLGTQTLFRRAEAGASTDSHSVRVESGDSCLSSNITVEFTEEDLHEKVAL